MPAAANPTDHRPRVAAERRERMRKRLIESALVVFAQKGVGTSVIPDVVAAAEVSQGSFYNYFRTNEDLLVAVSEQISNEMLQLIEGVVDTIEDPALRVATAIRCYLHLARSCRLVAHFVSGAGLRVAGVKSVLYEVLPPDLDEGVKRGQFDAVALGVAVDVIKGTVLVALHRMTQGRIAKDYPEQIVQAILRSLGVSGAAAARLTAAPLPRLAVPDDSLLARAQMRIATMASDHGKA
ncbi:TetR/AcrR family transcriptional regulator [Paraherbaspirillum soli]|uniref:TetR/AcrR family transcriptional regulator n=1 Tax=Paraherbaspirillum soli TaxID=631222 RepID=A0ABW0M717_9BURK